MGIWKQLNKFTYNPLTKVQHVITTLKVNGYLKKGDCLGIVLYQPIIN